MLNLAIDTSTTRGSVALGNNTALVQQITFDEKRASAALFPALEKIGLPRVKLSRIIIGIGPGSFSGIRVALAAARAIALTQDVPVLGVPSAYSIAAQHKDVSRLGVFADARRGEIYCTVFSQGAMERETYLLPKADLEDEASKMTLAVCSERVGTIDTRCWPQASDLLAVPDDAPGWEEGDDLGPIYLRDAVVTKSTPPSETSSDNDSSSADDTQALPRLYPNAPSSS